ncbi:MAG TPA: response regulator transcription factor [Pseudogracilibacillus sp.]|nr:response regulator transcription factor [Pseudogracilibacillus sp.]
METIIVVEDEKPISQVLQAYLKKEKYRVLPVFRGDEALDVIEREKPDLVLLDVMLPGKNGWTILEEIRSKTAIPVIMLSALGETPDRLKGFDIGADDYIPKPFVAEEVVARVKAVLRRNNREPGDVLTYGSLEVNPQAYEVRLNGKIIELTPKDLALLLFLAEHPNQAFTREQLIENVWGWDYEGSDRAVDLAIKRIRKALETWPKEEGDIKTLRGLGYQFRVQT